jgi:ubiquinone biosynthesis protein
MKIKAWRLSAMLFVLISLFSIPTWANDDCLDPLETLGAALDMNAVAEVLSQPLTSSADLVRMIATVNLMDPQSAQRFQAAAKAGVKFELGKKSAAFRSFDSIYDRPNTFAGKVHLAGKHSPIFEYVHELRHAVPHPGGGAKLVLDPAKQSVEEMEDLIRKQMFLDEAYSVEAEIQLHERMAKLGLDSGYDLLRPGIRDLYKEGGLLGLAEKIPEMGSAYNTHYSALAKRMVAELLHPTGESKKLFDYSGLALTRTQKGWELDIDAGKIAKDLQDPDSELSKKITPLKSLAEDWLKGGADLAKLPPVAQDVLASLKEGNLSNIPELLSQAARKSQDTAGAATAEKVPAKDPVPAPVPAPTPAKTELPARPERPESRREVASEGEQNLERVKIASHYLSFLDKKLKAEDGPAAVYENFHDHLKLAEAFGGRRSSEIYEKLQEAWKNHPKKFDDGYLPNGETLALSLYRSGFKKEGQEFAQLVLDLQAKRNVGSALRFIKELQKEGDASFVPQVAPLFERAFARQLVAYPRDTLKQLQDYEGGYTPEGLAEIEKFIEANKDRLITAKEILPFKRELHRRRQLVFKKDWGEDKLKDDDFKEKDGLKALGEFLDYAGSLADFSKGVPPEHGAEAQKLQALVERINSYQLPLRRRQLESRVEESQKFGLDPQKFRTRNLYESVRSIEFSEKANKEFDFLTHFEGIMTLPAQRLLRQDSREAHATAFSLLDELPATAKKILVMDKASEDLPANLPRPLFEDFMANWQRYNRDNLASLEDIDYLHPSMEMGLRGGLQGLLKWVKFNHPPASAEESYTGLSSRLAMVKAYLARPEADLRAKGLEMLKRMPDSQQLSSGWRYYISQGIFIHGVKPSGWSIHSLQNFRPASFKVMGFVAAAKADPARAREHLRVALDLVNAFRPNEKWSSMHDATDELFAHFHLLENLFEHNMLEEAQTLRSQLQRLWTQADQAVQARAEAFKKLSATQQQDRFSEQFELDSEVGVPSFWLQHVESKILADESLAAGRIGDEAQAQKLASELLESFRAEIKHRRGRFEILSMIQAAGKLAENPKTLKEAHEAFALSHEKLALLRGDRQADSAGIDYFFDKVDGAELLSLEQRDELLTGLINGMVPEDPGADALKSMGENRSFLKAVDKLSESGKYPKAELAALKHISSLTAKAHYAHDGKFQNIGTGIALRSAFARLTKRHPELFADGNLPKLKALSAGTEHQKALSLIFPSSMERSTASLINDGQLDLLRLETGNYDRLEASQEFSAALRLAHTNSDLPSLAKILKGYEILLAGDLNKLRTGRDKKSVISVAELEALPAVRELMETLGGKVTAKGTLDARDFEILRTLLHAPTSDHALGMRPLALKILSTPDVNLEAQRLALDSLSESKYLEEFTRLHYEEKIKGADEAAQRKFAERLLHLGDKGTSTPEFVSSYWLRHEAEADAIVARLKSRENASMLSSLPYERKFEVESYHSPEEFEKAFAKTAKREGAGLYLPQPDNIADVLATYDIRFDWFMQPREFLHGLEAVYVTGNFNPLDRNGHYFYWPELLEAEIAKIRPGFKMDNDERLGLMARFEQNRHREDHRYPATWPRGSGVLSYKQLIEVFPRLDFSESERSLLMAYLHGPDDMSTRLLVSSFGPFRLPPERKAAVAKLIADLREHLKEVAAFKETEGKVPAIIKKQPELSRFLMTEYFKELPFGQREKILEEFERGKTKLSDDEAVKRFFELTATEKIGQFLATRRDLVPENYQKQLEVFLENGEPSAFNEVRGVIEKELGLPVGQIFKEIEERPLNVGTIGEVYEATLKSGEHVVVKVITPSRRAAILQMLERMEKVADRLQSQKKRFHLAFDPRSLFKEFKDSVTEELNLSQEIQNGTRMRHALGDNALEVIVPRYHPHITSKSVLVQDFAKGKKISEITDTELRQKAIQKLGSSLIHQLLQKGFFHDDLHAGNFRVVGANADIELLDFGRVGILSEKERKLLVPLIMDVKMGNVEKLIDKVSELSPQQRTIDRGALATSLQSALSEKGVSFSTAMSRAFFECGRHGLPVNGAYLRVLKAVLSFEGTAKSYDPGFNFESFVVAEYMKTLFAK